MKRLQFLLSAVTSTAAFLIWLLGEMIVVFDLYMHFFIYAIYVIMNCQLSLNLVAHFCILFE